MQCHVYTVFVFQKLWTSCNDLWLCFFPSILKFFQKITWISTFLKCSLKITMTFKAWHHGNDQIIAIMHFLGSVEIKTTFSFILIYWNCFRWNIVYYNSVENVPIKEVPFSVLSIPFRLSFVTCNTNCFMHPIVQL